MSLKIAVIGGGSTYTPELVLGFLERTGAIPLAELCLMDTDEERLQGVGDFCQRMVAAQGQTFVVRCTGDRASALQGANYVITQMRVGQMAARREDEYLGKRHGLIGQETTGVGGMAKALRTIPAVLQVARDMASLAPSALLLNFANPSGLITEALSRYAPEINAAGLCNNPITTKMEILKALEKESGAPIAPERVQLDGLGLNHLSWYRGLTLDGLELWPWILERFIQEQESAFQAAWDSRTIAMLNMIPNHYLQYYYYTDRKLAEQEQWPPSRAESVMQIEARLLAQYAEPERVTPPAGLLERGGAYYSTLATQVIEAHYADRGQVHILNLPQRGAVPGWPLDWVLELPCRVDAAGLHPLPAEPLPPVCFGLLAQVKSYELLTVEAAVHGDRRAAYQALLAHPLGPPADRVGAVLGDMLDTHGAYLPQFQNRN